MLQSEQEKVSLAQELDAIRSKAAPLATRRDRAACEALSVLELLAHKLLTSPGKQVPVLTPAGLAAERLRDAGERFAEVAAELEDFVSRQRARSYLRGGAA